MAHSTKYDLLRIVVLHPAHLPPVAAHVKYAHTPVPPSLRQDVFNEIIEDLTRKGWFGRNVHTQREEKEAETKAEAVAALPDHMIADRCQGQRRKVACRSGRVQGKVRMSKERARERGQRGQAEVTAQRERREKNRQTVAT